MLPEAGLYAPLGTVYTRALQASLLFVEASPNKLTRLSDFSYNCAVKHRSGTPRITADAGVLLLREADYRLDVMIELATRLQANRDQRFVRYPMIEKQGWVA